MRGVGGEKEGATSRSSSCFSSEGLANLDDGVGWKQHNRMGRFFESKIRQHIRLKSIELVGSDGGERRFAASFRKGSLGRRDALKKETTRLPAASKLLRVTSDSESTVY